jgi:thiamine-phosphate pyrophosphorylase
MTTPRLFLVAPPDLSGEVLKACTEAAVKAGDCASILVPDSITSDGVIGLQSLGLAVIIRDCEPRQVHHLKADGIHISRSTPVKNLRTIFKSETIGVFAATSRHIAMEAAEAGADYIAFAQKSQTQGEPLLAWWHDIAELPSVAFDPVAPTDLATLLPQNPDFIRPLDSMWQTPADAKTVVSKLTQQLAL